jgi:hypothetical protein
VSQIDFRRYAVLLALFGHLVIGFNLAMAFIPGAFGMMLHIMAPPSLIGGFVFILVIIAWTIALPCFCVSLFSVSEGVYGGGGNKALFRVSSGLALGWTLAWACLIPHEKQGFGGGGVLSEMFFLALNFSGAICLVQEMPRFRVGFGWPMRFSLV